MNKKGLSTEIMLLAVVGVVAIIGLVILFQAPAAGEAKYRPAEVPGRAGDLGYCDVLQPSTLVTVSTVPLNHPRQLQALFASHATRIEERSMAQQLGKIAAYPIKCASATHGVPEPLAVSVDAGDLALTTTTEVEVAIFYEAVKAEAIHVTECTTSSDFATDSPFATVIYC